MSQYYKSQPVNNEENMIKKLQEEIELLKRDKIMLLEAQSKE